MTNTGNAAGAENNGLLPDDEELVQRARRGDELAAHQLVERHAASLFRLALALCGNVEDAEDVVQETFCGAWRGLSAFKGRSSVRTWLVSILINQTARLHRRRGRHRALPLEAAIEVPRGEPAVPPADQGANLRLDLMAAMAGLPLEQREVVVMRELEGMSYAQIAQVLGVPQGTVESRLFRARQELRKRLSDYLT